VIARRKKGLLAFRRHDDEQAAFLNNGQRVPGKMAATTTISRSGPCRHRSELHNPMSPLKQTSPARI